MKPTGNIATNHQKVFLFVVKQLLTSGLAECTRACANPARSISDVLQSLAAISVVFTENGPGLMPHAANVAVEQHYMKYREEYNSSFVMHLFTRSLSSGLENLPHCCFTCPLLKACS